MQYIITCPEHIDTSITLPASKSISNRALIIQALTKGGMMPENLSDCDDTEVIIRGLSKQADVIDIKAAGTAMRFMTAYLSATDGEYTITGTERMKHRPIGILVDALRSLGAEIEYVGEEGYPPFVSAWIIRARLLMLFDAGSMIEVSICSGQLTMYCMCI